MFTIDNSIFGGRSDLTAAVLLVGFLEPAQQYHAHSFFGPVLVRFTAWRYCHHRYFGLQYQGLVHHLLTFCILYLGYCPS